MTELGHDPSWSAPLPSMAGFLPSHSHILIHRQSKDFEDVEGFFFSLLVIKYGSDINIYLNLCTQGRLLHCAPSDSTESLNEQFVKGEICRTVDTAPC